MRAMVVRQGIGATTAGRGALNAAYAGLGQLSGIIFPLLWGGLYKFFLRQSQEPSSSVQWLQWGAGGHVRPQQAQEKKGSYCRTCVYSLNLLAYLT